MYIYICIFFTHMYIYIYIHIHQAAYGSYFGPPKRSSVAGRARRALRADLAGGAAAEHFPGPSWASAFETLSLGLQIAQSRYYLPGPPKEPKIMAQYLKTESIGSIGSIILAILEVQVHTLGPKVGIIYILGALWQGSKVPNHRVSRVSAQAIVIMVLGGYLIVGYLDP